MNNSDDYQAFTRTTAKYPKETMLQYLLLGLASEVGEVHDKFKKPMRDGYDPDHQAIIKELGDVLWYVARIADEMGVPLSVVMFENQRKLSSRLERDVISGSGDDR